MLTEAAEPECIIGGAAHKARIVSQLISNACMPISPPTFFFLMHAFVCTHCLSFSPPLPDVAEVHSLFYGLGSQI